MFTVKLVSTVYMKSIFYGLWNLTKHKELDVKYVLDLKMNQEFTDFGIDNNKKDEIIQYGYDKAKQYFLKYIKIKKE